jgi:NAD-dependent deacetylase
MVNIVILTGAGISAESGLATFRAEDGTWNTHDVMKVATPEGFAADPDLVHEFYNSRRAELGKVQPNAAHVSLGKLEKAWENTGGFLVVTQNVDDLHERGGTQNIAHMHGELLSIRCTNQECRHKDRTAEPLTTDDKCPSCGSGLRPDVVWFGEMPKGLYELEQVLDHTDILISIGTSGSVMPASLFPSVVRQANPDALILEVNLHPTFEMAFSEVFEGPAGEILPDLVDRLIEYFVTNPKAGSAAPRDFSPPRFENTLF